MNHIDIRPYSHPFSGAYWKSAAKEFSSLRHICYAALLCAMAIILEWFQIPLSETLYISVSFVAVSICSMITGPLMAIPCGIIVDLVGYAIHPTGPFFPGYTLTAVLSAFVYALFLYRARASFARVAGAKGLVNLVINTFIGSIWRVVLYGSSPFLYYICSAGVKNILLFPLEVSLLCWLLGLLWRPLVQLGAVPDGPSVLLDRKRVVFLVLLTVLGAACLVLFVVFYPQITSVLRGWFPKKG